ncbi:MAG: NifB/NifX family molybdenum-iron cluster-binding protein [Bacteroidales bacterium]|nr:NifB/NifX family molybdenum-iron cluster-binding protein [Bacteroidales bacterium]
MTKVAIPVSDGILSQHFGHCQHFTLYHISDGAIVNSEILDAPPHQPGLLPKWLAEKGATDILAGGMGQRAIAIFHQFKINVFVGVPGKSADDLVKDYLQGILETNENACDH